MVDVSPLFPGRPHAEALAAEAVLVDVPLGVALEMCKMAVADLDDEERRAEVLAVWAGLKVEGALAIADAACRVLVKARRAADVRPVIIDGEEFGQMRAAPAFSHEKPGMISEAVARRWFPFVFVLALLVATLVLI